MVHLLDSGKLNRNCYKTWSGEIYKLFLCMQYAIACKRHAHLNVISDVDLQII